MTDPNLVGFGYTDPACAPECFPQTVAYNFGLGVVRNGNWLKQTLPSPVTTPSRPTCRRSGSPSRWPTPGRWSTSRTRPRRRTQRTRSIRRSAPTSPRTTRRLLPDRSTPLGDIQSPYGHRRRGIAVREPMVGPGDGGRAGRDPRRRRSPPCPVQGVDRRWIPRLSGPAAERARVTGGRDRPANPRARSSEAGYTFAGVTSDPHRHEHPARPRTDADRVADDYFDAAVALSPIMATNAGIPGHEEDLDDFSPAGRAAFSALRRQHPGRPGRRRAGRRRRPRDDLRAAQPARAGRGDPRRRPRRDVAQRHRVPAAGPARRLRPDAPGHRGELGDLRHPDDQAADRARPVPRVPARRSRQGPRGPPPPGRPRASSSAPTSRRTTGTSPRWSPARRSTASPSPATPRRPWPRPRLRPPTPTGAWASSSAPSCSTPRPRRTPAGSSGTA